jgi:rhodanese-related sulfurtransferase
MEQSKMPFVHIGGCLAVALILATAAERTPIEFTKDTLEVVKTNVAKKTAVLVDVRSREEWDKGHIEGSIFLPVDSLRKDVDPKMLAKNLPKDKILYSFCVVGMRAKAAATKLEKYGYTVRALKPGYEELAKAGFKKGKDEKSERPAANEDTRKQDAG